MALNSSERRTQLLMTKRLQLQDGEPSPEGAKTWLHKQGPKEVKVPVIYYLSHNGQLEHPHFMEVSLSSSDQGLRLKDVMKRLDQLRGHGMSTTYSWSAKRGYKNGFVWQDLSENDILHTSHGNEYVLKGSKLLEASQSFRSHETVSSSSSSFSCSSSSNTNSSFESYRCSEDSNFPARRKSDSWVSFDEIRKHRIYKVERDGEFLRKAANAATQTEDEGRGEREEREAREEVCVPFSSYGGEGDERSADVRDQRAENDQPSGRMVVPTVLMQLVSCGSKKVKA